ncbi:unnamed protein product, partial [Urochloa humidicola]
DELPSRDAHLATPSSQPGHQQAIDDIARRRAAHGGGNNPHSSRPGEQPIAGEGDGGTLRAPRALAVPVREAAHMRTPAAGSLQRGNFPFRCQISSPLPPAPPVRPRRRSFHESSTDAAVFPHCSHLPSLHGRHKDSNNFAVPCIFVYQQLCKSIGRKRARLR